MAKRKPAKRGWIKPEGMSKKMAEEVLAGKICGARRFNKDPWDKDADFCHARPAQNSREQRPHPPYRCRLHGGATKEVNRNFKLGNKFALKHGIYSDVIMPEEENIYNAINADDVDEEIKICKIRLRRALVMELRQKKLLDKGKEGDDEIKAGMHLKEASKKVYVEKLGKEAKRSRAETTEVRASVNYARNVKDISNELYKFFQVKALQNQQGNNMSDHDRAKRVQEEIRKIEASIEEIEVAVEGAGVAVPSTPDEPIDPPEEKDDE